LIAFLYISQSLVEFAPQKVLFSGHLLADPLTAYFSLLIIAIALGVVILTSNNSEEEGIEANTEFHALMLFGVVGALVLVSAAHAITLFLGLEILSMSLYALCAAAPGKRRSSESALKYFLLGSFSSAFLLLGFAILYGLTGTLDFSMMASQLGRVDHAMTLLAFACVAFGALFKVGAVPFHFWVPDVYQGAPTPVTAFMACAVKAAGFAVVMRLFVGLFAASGAQWSAFVGCVAALTMVAGNVLALQQRSMRRMLAYSSIAHAGYLMVGVLAFTSQGNGVGAVAYYLPVYAAMTLGALAIVQVVSAPSATKRASDDISLFQGLGRTSPFLAGCFSLFLFSLAGLPPGVAGLVGKFFLFSAAIRADYVLLSVLGVLSSAVSCYYYLRVVVAMYFVEPDLRGDAPPPYYHLSAPLGLLLLAAAVLVSVGGLFPAPLYEAARHATQAVL
jgi:NADH-quinone oxidoreductase subunit N